MTRRTTCQSSGPNPCAPASASMMAKLPSSMLRPSAVICRMSFIARLLCWELTEHGAVEVDEHSRERERATRVPAAVLDHLAADERGDAGQPLTRAQLEH